MDDKKKTNLGTPTGDTDAVNKVYVDGFAFKTNDAPVIFIVGEANAEGLGTQSDLGTNFDFDILAGTVKIWDKNFNISPDNIPQNDIHHIDWGEWKYYEVGGIIFTITTGFSHEWQIAKRWSTDYPDKTLYIIKCASSSSSLFPNNNRYRSWSTIGEDNLRDMAIKYYGTPALDDLKEQGLNPKCLAIIWAQGETDARDVDEYSSYETRLADIITDFRNGLGFNNARVLIMQLSSYISSVGWNSVKQQQQNHCDNTNDILVPTGNFCRYAGSNGSGSIHYESNGLISLGNEYYDNFDFHGAKHSKTWDFEFFGQNKIEDIENIRETYGDLQTIHYPHTEKKV